MVRDIDGGDRRQLGGAVPFGRLDAELLFEGGGQVQGKLFGPDHDHVDRLKLFGLDSLEVGLEEGRCRQHQRHLVLLAELPDRSGIQRVEVVRDCRAVGHRQPERHRVPEGVEERQDAEQRVFVCQMQELVDGIEIGADIPV